MTRNAILVDIENTKTHVIAVLKQSLDKAMKILTEELHREHDGNVCEGGIQGLREQITANMVVLLPFLKNTNTKFFAINKNMTLTPEVHIITFGQEGRMTACVYLGPGNDPKKFLVAQKGDTTAAALKNLLELTEDLLEGFITGCTRVNIKRDQATAKDFGLTASYAELWSSEVKKSDLPVHDADYVNVGYGSGSDDGKGVTQPNSNNFGSPTTATGDDTVSDTNTLTGATLVNNSCAATQFPWTGIAAYRMR